MVWGFCVYFVYMIPLETDVLRKHRFQKTHVFMWDSCTVWLFCFAGSISISPSTLNRLQILHAFGYPHFNAYHSDTFYRAAVLYISIYRADNFLSNDAPSKKF